MKQYNLSEIMKRAHDLYNNAGKYSWAEALKKSWKMAKFDVMIASKLKALKEEAKAKAEEEQELKEQAAIRTVLFKAQIEADRIKREAKAKVERMKDEIAARKEGISYTEYQERLNRAMGYWCGHYCGD